MRQHNLDVVNELRLTVSDRIWYESKFCLNDTTLLIMSITLKCSQNIFCIHLSDESPEIIGRVDNVPRSLRAFFEGDSRDESGRWLWPKLSKWEPLHSFFSQETIEDGPLTPFPGAKKIANASPTCHWITLAVFVERSGQKPRNSAVFWVEKSLQTILTPKTPENTK